MKKESVDIKTIVGTGKFELKPILKLIWTKRYILLLTVGIAFTYAMYLAYTSKREYVSESKLLLEGATSSANVSTALSGIVGLAGLNMGDASTGEGLEPSIYPEILESESFLLDIAYERFYVSEFKDSINLVTYFNQPDNNKPIDPKSVLSKRTNIGLDNVSISDISAIEQNTINELKKRIKLKLAGRFVELTAKMPEPRFSAELNKRVTIKLINYVVSYKTAKRVRDTDFIRERTDEAKRNYLNAQSSLAGYKDSNLGLLFQRGRSKEEQLQNQYNLYFNIYNTLAAQLEQARIKLKEETPVFTQFDPVSVPTAPSEPQRVKIILLYTSFGIFLGGLFTLCSLLYDYLK